MEIKEIWFIKKWVITFYNLWSCVTKWSTNSFGFYQGLFQKEINWVVPKDVGIQEVGSGGTWCDPLSPNQVARGLG